MLLCEVDTLKYEMHCNPFQFLPICLIVKIEIIPRLPERNLDSVPIWFPVSLRIYRSVEPEQQHTKARIAKRDGFPEFGS